MFDVGIDVSKKLNKHGYTENEVVCRVVRKKDINIGFTPASVGIEVFEYENG